jgi:hypothetical protein
MLRVILFGGICTTNWVLYNLRYTTLIGQRF